MAYYYQNFALFIVFGIAISGFCKRLSTWWWLLGYIIIQSAFIQFFDFYSHFELPIQNNFQRWNATCLLTLFAILFTNEKLSQNFLIKLLTYIGYASLLLLGYQWINGLEHLAILNNSSMSGGFFMLLAFMPKIKKRDRILFGIAGLLTFRFVPWLMFIGGMVALNMGKKIFYLIPLIPLMLWLAMNQGYDNRRFYLYKEAFLWAKDKFDPLFGAGFGSFFVVGVNLQLPDTFVFMHSDILQVYFELGIVGIFLFSVGILSSLGQASKERFPGIVAALIFASFDFPAYYSLTALTIAVIFKE